LPGAHNVRQINYKGGLPALSRRARAFSRSLPWTDLDPERRNAVMLIAAVGAIILFAVGIIGYGYYSERIAPKRATVLEVGDRKFDYGALERRAIADSPGSFADGDAFLSHIVGTLANIEREELVRQTADRLNVTATSEEVEASLYKRLGLLPEATREQFAPRLQTELLSTGLSQAELRDIERAVVLEEKLRAQFSAAVPAASDHADARLIQVATQMEADSARQRLTDGDDFSTVAVQVSRHSSRSAAGELGWVPRNSLPPALEEFAFNNLGLSGVIQTDDGFFILESRGQEVRDITDTTRAQVAEQTLSNELRTTRDAVGAQPSLTTGQIQSIAQAIQDRG
jgi:hypothetical protein